VGEVAADEFGGQNGPAERANTRLVQREPGRVVDQPWVGCGGTGRRVRNGLAVLEGPSLGGGRQPVPLHSLGRGNLHR
jgi:hypothetical protein